MFSLAQLSIFICVFFIMMAIVNLLPELFTTYQERYKVSLRQTARELNKFFFNVKPLKIILGVGTVGVVIGFLTGSWVVALALSIVGVFAPKIILSLWKEIRSGQFDAQLMDALVLMGNVLKSGLDVAGAIERIATTMKPPISEEFGLVLNAYRLGTPLEAALLDLTERIQSRTLETIVYAINMQRETGGNIIKTFDQLILTIREENKLQKKVRAMTSQGRMQIFFLAGFPWLLGALFFLMAPEFMKPALANSWGQLTIIVLIVWEAIGILVTRRIVRVDV